MIVGSQEDGEGLMKNDLTNLSIDQACTLLSQRAFSAAELVEETLDRIAETEPIIHAYALVLADQARAAR